MGLDYHFHFQTKTSEGWIVPDAFTNPDGYCEILGYFTWFDDKDVSADLFWGKKALFPMQHEFPPDIENTLIFRRLGPAFAEHFHSWIPFEELLLDYWDGTHLLVSKRIIATYAFLFGDGRQPFPHEALLSEGMDLRDVQYLENTSYYVSDAEIVEEPIDYTQGKARWVLEGGSPEHLVKITWKVSVSSFLGEWRTEAFHKLRQYGTDEELRVICLFS